jgi:hypothetical protein
MRGGYTPISCLLAIHPLHNQTYLCLGMLQLSLVLDVRSRTSMEIDWPKHAYTLYITSCSC